MRIFLVTLDLTQEKPSFWPESIAWPPPLTRKMKSTIALRAIFTNLRAFLKEQGQKGDSKVSSAICG